MASTLLDSPPAVETEPEAAQQPAAGSPAPSGGATASSGPACASCGMPLAPGQDWCFNCGSSVQPGSDGSGWRPAATVLAATAVLVLGAAAAGYAALSKHAPARKVVTTAVAQAPPVTTPPAATTPPPASTTPLGAQVPGLGTAKPPKIPLTAQTPTTTTPTTTTPAGTTPAGKKSTEKEAANTGGSGAETKPKPLLLDTNAASTYNPYDYASTLFGDPSLTIDGDKTTAWTAQINPETSPRLAEGMLIDLHSARELSSVKLITSSPGMTVQVYGANGKAVPTSITDPAWVTLTPSIVVKKKTITIKLKHRKQGFSFVTLWISGAGEKSVGTPTAPGHVSVNELELFPS